MTIPSTLPADDAGGGIRISNFERIWIGKRQKSGNVIPHIKLILKNQ